MRITRGIVTAAFIILGPISASADPILPQGGIWSAVTQPDQDGTPFWDNPTQDNCDTSGGQCNAGQAILGQHTTQLVHPLDPNGGPLEYLHDGTGNAVPFFFTNSVLDWLPEFTITIFWDGTPGQIQDPSNPLDGALTYTIPGVGTSTPIFSANSILDFQQFALFRQRGPDATRYFFAFEDAAGAASDYDYNDLIMSSPVPEPGTIVLVGTVLLGLAGRRALRRKS